MHHSKIIFLLLSSLLLSSCAYHHFSSYKKKSDFKIPVENFNNFQKAAKYKASIDVLNKHFTGIVVYKKTDTATWHLVFVTELGMTMFDFIVQGDSMRPIFVFEGLNKPQTVNALVRNFETIFFVKSYNKTLEVREKSGEQAVYLKDGDREHFFIEDAQLGLFQQQWVFYKHKRESTTFYISNYDRMKLEQYGLIKLYIELDKIKEQ